MHIIVTDQLEVIESRVCQYQEILEGQVWKTLELALHKFYVIVRILWVSSPPAKIEKADIEVKWIPDDR